MNVSNRISKNCLLKSLTKTQRDILCYYWIFWKWWIGSEILKFLLKITKYCIQIKKMCQFLIEIFWFFWLMKKSNFWFFKKPKNQNNQSNKKSLGIGGFTYILTLNIRSASKNWDDGSRCILPNFHCANLEIVWT